MVNGSLTLVRPRTAPAHGPVDGRGMNFESRTMTSQAQIAEARQHRTAARSGDTRAASTSPRSGDTRAGSTARRIAGGRRDHGRRVALHVRHGVGSPRSTVTRSYRLSGSEPRVGVLEVSLGAVAFTFGLAIAVAVNPLLPF